MEQYISKDALLAEMESLRCSTFTDFGEGFNAAVQTILKVIDTIEVKGVENTEVLKVRGYLVRDKDDYTAIYAEKPHRGKTEWVDSNDSCLMTINDARLVPDIEFEDEPVEVELTLKRLNAEG